MGAVVEDSASEHEDSDLPCNISLEEFGSRMSEQPMPQRIQRNGAWIDVWPEHWGMTMRQIRELMDDCKEDVDWHQSNSVRDMVRNHILPRTAGKGVGYALKINHQSPLEVEVLVSHSWNENAEEFVETLERTVRPDEVLFVCAFAIYQNEDDAGPTVSEQIGASMNESPFGRVLKHIQGRGRIAGWWWWPRRTLFILPGLCLLVALEIFMVSQLVCGGVPGPSYLYVLEQDKGQICGGWRSAGSGTCFATRWVVEDLVSYCRPAFPLTWCFACLAGVVAIVLHLFQHRVYCGRMLAVPNYQDNLYQRLWCVYEIFMASQLKVYVGLAQTLAPAGKCKARTARCSNSEDEARIRRAIEAFGARCVHQRRSNSHLAVLDIFAGDNLDPAVVAAETGYRRVDAAIRWTTSRAQREWLWVMLRIMLLGTALQGSVTVLSYSMGLLRQYFAIGYILAFFLYMLIMWAILRRTGCLQRKHLLVLGLLPLVGGVLLVGIADWLAPAIENHSLDVLAAMGFVFIMFAISSLFLPLTRIRKYGGNWRGTFLFMVGALTWLLFYAVYAVYLQEPFWNFRNLSWRFLYASLLQTLALNIGPPLLACYIWSFLLAWGVRMQIVDRDPSVTEHVMQGVVDLRDSSLNIVEEGFTSGFGNFCFCAGVPSTESDTSSTSSPGSVASSGSS